MAEPIVTVRGHAVVPGEPDEVEVALLVTGLASTPEEAHRDVAERSALLDRVFSKLRIAKPSRSTTGVSVREETEYVKGASRHVGFRASNRIRVRLRDASLVGPLMREATAKAQARVDGPWWRIALDNPARVAACREAAADARRKAEGYASALGVKVGSVLAVQESGLDRRSRPSDEPPMALALAMEDRASVVDVEAGELDVSASVEVTFSLAEGPRRSRTRNQS